MTVRVTEGRFTFEFKRPECGHIYRTHATWESKASTIEAEKWAAENTLCAVCARQQKERPELDDAFSHMHHWRPQVTLKEGHFLSFNPLDVSFICPKCRLYVFGAWFGSGYVCANCALLDPELDAANKRLQADWNSYKSWEQKVESEETFFVKKGWKK
jgi:hypothetical protein